MAVTGIGYGSPNFTTSVGPNLPYSPIDTASGMSQQYAQAGQQAAMPSILKGLYNPSGGTSMSPALMARGAAQQGNILAGGQMGAAGVQSGDAFANANALLQGQSARENQALQLAQLASNQQNQNFGQGMQLANQGMGLLGSLYSGA